MKNALKNLRELLMNMIATYELFIFIEKSILSIYFLIRGTTACNLAQLKEIALKEFGFINFEQTKLPECLIRNDSWQGSVCGLFGGDYLVYQYVLLMLD